MTGSKQEFEKYFFFMIMAGAVILLANIYYYVHPLMERMGLTHDFVDALFVRLHKGGLFNYSAKTKLMALVLICPCLLSRTGLVKNISAAVIAAIGGSGLVLYFLPAWYPWLYIVTSLAGGFMVFWAVGMISRRTRVDEIYGEDETFPQCEKLMETSSSVNLPTKFVYQGRERKGWINLVALERGLMVIGNPGSGKSFSAFEPCIETMIRKGYTMLLYDFKYPTLSDFAYNQYRKYRSDLKNPPKFCVINLSDPRTSLRFNPINPAYIRDPSDSGEIAEIVMQNINKGAQRKEDFFSDSAKVYLDAVIWFLRCYENGRYCTFPHVLQMLTHNYSEVLEILETYKENLPKIVPFVNAMHDKANEQLQGMLASTQIPVSKLSSKEVYWILSGDDGELDINNPKRPKILCLGNCPDRESINGTLLALYTSRIFTEINKPGKMRCGVMLDELPTIFLKGLDKLIATARSNKVATVIGMQDFSQLVRDYGEKNAEVIYSTVANTISGQVSGKTAERMSKMFGKRNQTKQSETIGRTNDSVNISRQKEEVLPISRIETLSQGEFFGKVADCWGNRIDRKFFHGVILRDPVKAEEEKKKWKPLPTVRDFGEDAAERRVRENAHEVLMEHFRSVVLSRGVRYEEDEIEIEMLKLEVMTPDAEKKSIIEKKVKQARDKAYFDVLDGNYDRIVREVANIVKSELERIRMRAYETDPRITEPFHGFW